MKTILFTATLALALSSGAAYAGEGAGDPFPFRAPGVVTLLNGHAVLPPAGTDPFPFRADGSFKTTSMSDAIYPSNGAQSGLETVNSLPKGFEDGTVAMMRRNSVHAYWQSHGASAIVQEQGALQTHG